MKKLLIIFALMAMAVPMYAGDVQFVGTDNGDGTMTISYVVTGGTIRGMALNVDADAAVTDVAVDSFFDVFMDAAYMDPDNYVLGVGTPIANQDVAGEIGLPSNSFCISMGNLEGVATSDEIVIIAPAGTTVTLDINTLRGGIVDTDGNEMTTNLPVTLAEPDCVKAEAFFYADWVAFGSPDCWCYPKQCRGDSDGKAQFGGIVPVYTDDLDIFISAYGQPNPLPTGAICADFNHAAQFNGAVRVYTDDLNIFIAAYGQPGITDCDMGDYNFFIRP